MLVEALTNPMRFKGRGPGQPLPLCPLPLTGEWQGHMGEGHMEWEDHCGCLWKCHISRINSADTIFFFFFFFLGLLLRHMDVRRLGVESELQQPAHTTATATWDLSLVCDLHHNSRQCRLLNTVSKARDRTHFLMDTSWVCNLLSHSGNSRFCF